MGDKHEEDVCASLPDARKSRGSGNQAHNPMDGRQSRYDVPFALAVDCKSTLGKSIGVSREMWKKAVEQSHGENPGLPLRFYDTERLDVGLDLIVIDWNHYLELREWAIRGYEAQPLESEAEESLTVGEPGWPYEICGSIFTATNGRPHWCDAKTGHVGGHQITLQEREGVPQPSVKWCDDKFLDWECGLPPGHEGFHRTHEGGAASWQ